MMCPPADLESRLAALSPDTQIVRDALECAGREDTPAQEVRRVLVKLGQVHEDLVADAIGAATGDCMAWRLPAIADSHAKQAEVAQLLRERQRVAAFRRGLARVLVHTAGLPRWMPPRQLDDALGGFDRHLAEVVPREAAALLWNEVGHGKCAALLAPLLECLRPERRGHWHISSTEARGLLAHEHVAQRIAPNVISVDEHERNPSAVKPRWPPVEVIDSYIERGEACVLVETIEREDPDFRDRLLTLIDMQIQLGEHVSLAARILTRRVGNATGMPSLQADEVAQPTDAATAARWEFLWRDPYGRKAGRLSDRSPIPGWWPRAESRERTPATAPVTLPMGILPRVYADSALVRHGETLSLGLLSDEGLRVVRFAGADGTECMRWRTYRGHAWKASVELSPGPHTLRLFVEDEHGNVFDEDVSVTIEADGRMAYS